MVLQLDSLEYALLFEGSLRELAFPAESLFLLGELIPLINKYMNIRSL